MQMARPASVSKADRLCKAVGFPLQWLWMLLALRVLHISCAFLTVDVQTQKTARHVRERVELEIVRLGASGFSYE